MQTSNLNDTTLHEIGDLDREISAFFSKKASLNENRPHSVQTPAEPFVLNEDNKIKAK